MIYSVLVPLNWILSSSTIHHTKDFVRTNKPSNQHSVLINHWKIVHDIQPHCRSGNMPKTSAAVWDSSYQNRERCHMCRCLKWLFHEKKSEKKNKNEIRYLKKKKICGCITVTESRLVPNILYCTF